MCAPNRDDALLLGEADDGKVALGAARCGIDDDVDGLLPREGKDHGACHQRINVTGPKTLLQGIKSQSR